jgi:hypothetical protein
MVPIATLKPGDRFLNRELTRGVVVRRYADKVIVRYPKQKRMFPIRGMWKLDSPTLSRLDPQEPVTMLHRRIG